MLPTIRAKADGKDISAQRLLSS
jgi:Phage integrase family